MLIEKIKGREITAQRVEVVERKGKGHPDSICDAVMEAVSLALCRKYQDVFGEIRHHNIDKGLLAAGKTRKAFGGGSVITPMKLFIGDRADFGTKDNPIPVKDIAQTAAREWIQHNLRYVDPLQNIRYEVVIEAGSEELTDIFDRSGDIREANDTSAATGFYPLNPTENMVLSLERHLNSSAFKERFPETGEDVKVMGLRRDDHLDITVAMPLVCRYVDSVDDYFHRKQAVFRAIIDFAETQNNSVFKEIQISYNSLDRRERGLNGIYLTVTGTSAEDGDSGQVGRGNRVNGLISLNRPMGTEAAAGKNPVSHVGKIYNILAHQMARRIYEGVSGISEVNVLFLSRIGMPVDQPAMAHIRVALEKGQSLKSVTPAINDIYHGSMKNMGQFTRELALGKYPVC